MTFDPALELIRSTVLPEWIDYNGHMNVAYYVLAFDQALDRLCDRLEIGIDYVRRTNGSIFVLEAHVNYLQEVHKGDPLLITAQLLDVDTKRFHFFMRMYHAGHGFLAATSEQVAMHVDLGQRRSTPFPERTRELLSDLSEAHRELPQPPQAGRVIRLPGRPA